MTIGLCAGIPLQDPAGTSRHGAVFLLRNKSVADAEITLFDGWTTTVAAGTNAVVTRGPSSSTSFYETHTEALRAANNGLDYVCMRGWGSAAIRSDSDDCLVWWPDPVNGIILRARVIHTTRAQMRFTATVTDKDGNVVYDPPAPPPTPAQHDALRFIRMSRTSEYLFDAYRNMFLALERLLSDIRPRRPGEREKDWLTAALQQAEPIVSATKLAPAGEAAPIDWFYTNMYADERSGLMHAKPGLYHLPQDDASRARLQASLRVLWDYVRALASAVVGVEHSRSGFSARGWEEHFKPTFENMILFVTDKDLSLDRSDDETAEIIRNNVIRLPTDAPVTEGPMLRTRLGGVEAAKLQSLGWIVGMGALAPTGGDPLSFGSELPGPLRLGTSVTRFEMLAGWRNLNLVDLPTFSA